METNDGAVQQLETWLRSNPAAFVHPHLRFAQDSFHGGHWRARESIPAETTLISIPHSLCLSYLNALVDDAYPVFKDKRAGFTVEAIGFFYLMLQYIHRADSFWRPYLESLPRPDSEQMSTPLWFDSESDRIWLEHTDVAETMNKRKAIYEQYYNSGRTLIADSGVDVTQFSWDLFRWAITMFTSRSFSSTAIAPQDTKYWAAYRTGRNGDRQAVLLDMAHISSADLTFSVLFPGMDTGNHSHNSPALWRFESGKFSLALGQDSPKDSQVYNNYGPKANHELLQGYGFTIDDNPKDTVLLTLRPPRHTAQQKIRAWNAGFFDSEGRWLPEKATFGLSLPSVDTDDVFAELPKALLEVLAIMIKDEQDLVFDPVCLLDDVHSVAEWHRLFPHIARIISTFLRDQQSRLEVSLGSPRNNKQRFAKTYRDGQRRIRESYLHAFNLHMQSRLQSRASTVRLVALGEVLSDMAVHHSAQHREFMAGVHANAQSTDLDVLRNAGWEDDIWVLLLYWLALSQLQGGMLEPVTLLTSYYKQHSIGAKQHACPEGQIASWTDLVRVAAATVPESVWQTAVQEDLLDLCGKVVNNECVVLPDKHGGPVAMLLVCVG